MILDEFLVAKLLSGWLFGYSALISIINPIGGAFIFQGMTQWLTPRARARLARAIAVNSFIVLVVALFLGSRVLGFFGISLEALRIGGGLAVAVAGWNMLSEDPARHPKREAPEAMDTAPVESMAFFPLTLPLTTGPGTIAACIALSAGQQAQDVSGDVLAMGLSAMLVAVSVAATVWVAYANAEALVKRLGPQGTLVAAKVTAFLLLCIGVQIMLTGATDALRPLLAPRGIVP